MFKELKEDIHKVKEMMHEQKRKKSIQTEIIKKKKKGYMGGSVS